MIFDDYTYSSVPTQDYTLVSNDLLDQIAHMSYAELCVILTVVRWTNESRYVAVSFSGFMKLTGLTRKSVKAGIDTAIADGYIRIAGRTENGTNIYALTARYCLIGEVGS